MNLLLLFPARVKPRALASAIDEYAARLEKGISLETYVEEKVDRRPPPEIRHAESLRLLKRVRPDDYLVACDERGRLLTTEDLVRFLADARGATGPLAGRARAVVALGGALGFSPDVLQRADAVWSLSGLVLAGAVARLVLLEGLYRAASILDGHPYHNA